MRPGIKTEFIEKHKLILFALLAIGIIGFILAMPAFLKLVEFLGQRIPQKDIRVDYIKGLVWAVFLGSTIFFWPIRSHDKKALLWAWSVKCFIMLGFMLFYEYHYQLDSFNYFSGARHDMSEWKALEIAGKSFPIVFITWLHQNSFLNSFHATKVSFGMIGLVGVYIFYRSVVAFLQQEKLWLLYFFALFPSILFWSSILGKEPLILLFIAIYCYGVIKLVRTGSFVYIFCALLGIFLVSFFRSWMGPILILPMFISTLTVTMKNRKIKIAAIIVLFLASLFFISQPLVHFNIKSSEDLTTQANVKYDNFARGGSSIRVDKIESIAMPSKEKSVRVDKIESIAMPNKEKSEDTDRIKFNSLRQMILYIPQGIFTVLFRPLPGEVYNVFGFLAGIEDSFLLILFALAMKRLRWRELLDSINIWAILLILIWACVYAFVGFNLGTVCRYRLQILPVFLGLLMYLARSRDMSTNCKNR